MYVDTPAVLEPGTPGTLGTVKVKHTKCSLRFVV